MLKFEKLISVPLKNISPTTSTSVIGIIRKQFSKMSTTNNSNTPSFPIATRLVAQAQPTVWHEFTPLAMQYNAIALGQGFPGWSPPDFICKAAANAINQIHEVVEENPVDGLSANVLPSTQQTQQQQPLNYLIHQYARSYGHLPLVNELAKIYGRRLNQKLDPAVNFLVTVGASEALCVAMLGHLNEGDEIIMLEPAFDIYIAQAKMCGAIIRPVPLRLRPKSKDSSSPSSPPIEGVDDEYEFYLDMNEFRQAFSERTKMFILNTPQNPTGKVFSRPELEQIASILNEYPKCITLCDEVYEYMTYDNHEHISLASLPGMWERTLTISSAGKTFSTTGWKIGWIIGTKDLITAPQIAHQWLTFSTCTPLQHAIATSFQIARSRPYEGHVNYFDYLTKSYLRKREILCQALQNAGIKPIIPQGGFFIIGDTSNIEIPKEYLSEDVPRDWAFCRWLTKEIGIGAIPPSSFHCDENKHIAANFARFAFCKPDEMLEEAGKRLMKLRDFLKK
jgi:kynurenine--oxoglutarate transaminase/cysteine-S-conjugate beta-lyase/glutamine--phenylpyruvate transaminase